MRDLPKAVRISEEGPREGFQIESGPISTARKIELIDALSETGIKHLQIVSFVNPKRVPGMDGSLAVALSLCAAWVWCARMASPRSRVFQRITGSPLACS